jgi:muramidase (phage lysozyme)
MTGYACEKEQKKTDNIKAFLKLIRYAEHKREDDDVYFHLLGGKLKSYDTSAHPIHRLNARGKCPDIAGAYHHNLETWEEAYFKGTVSDFSPAAQDKLAIDKLIAENALQYVETGDVENAIRRISAVWTTLPGAINSSMEMNEAKQRFAKYLLELGHKKFSDTPACKQKGS